MKKEKRILIVGIIGSILILSLVLALFGIMNKTKELAKEENFQDVYNPDIINQNINNDDKQDTVETIETPKSTWEFDNTQGELVADFTNAQWGRHLEEFKEYDLESSDDPVFVIAYNKNNGMQYSKLIALYNEKTTFSNGITKTTSNFPLVCSKPIDIELSEKFINELLEDEDTETYYESNYTFLVVYNSYSELNKYLTALEFINYSKEVGYPTDWIREDKYYYEIFKNYEIDNPFWDYFNFMQRITLEDGSVFIAKRVNHFENVKNSKDTYNLKEMAEKDKGIKSIYNKLKNNDEFLAFGEYEGDTPAIDIRPSGGRGEDN